MIHPFICKAEGGVKFTVDSEIADIEDLRKKGVFCPHCGSKWGNPDSKIEWFPQYQAVARPSRNHIALDNQAMSQEAQRAAAEDRAMRDQIDPPAGADPATGKYDPTIRQSDVDMIQRRAEELLG